MLEEKGNTINGLRNIPKPFLGILRQYFTQNIDGLDKLAGISDDKLVQVHGSFDSSHCTECEREVDQALINEGNL